MSLIIRVLYNYVTKIDQEIVLSDETAKEFTTLSGSSKLQYLRETKILWD